MRIQKLALQNNVILAPMAGITDLPYRRLMKSFGAGLVFTEMVSANGLIRAGRRTRELLRSVAAEQPLGIQLFGDDPEILAEATALVRTDGDLIDLNVGCPVNKVVRSGAGCALMRDPTRAAAAIRAMRQATELPLTVKIRAGWDSSSINFLQIAKSAVDEGADAVILHPRTRTQGFGGKADWDLIRQLKKEIPVPVIGSGDIFSPEDALAMERITGCDGLMIGRGGYGNPWLIRDILLRQSGNPTPPVTPEERRDVALHHMELYLETFPEQKAVRDLRKHLAWYSRGLPGATHFRSRINTADTLRRMREEVENFFSAAAAG